MKITKVIQAQANKLMEKHQLKAVFVNNKGEFFTKENQAGNSVSGNKKQYVRIEAKASETNKESIEETTELKKI
ncbi:MAG: hypothetical protein ACK5L5_04120 [Bacteroidales bacterium]